jgi:hypothetical protein
MVVGVVGELHALLGSDPVVCISDVVLAPITVLVDLACQGIRAGCA